LTLRENCSVGRLSTIPWNFTEKLMAYALCRQLEGYDEVVLDKLMEKIAKDDYRVQTIISEIVTSYPFTQRRIRDEIEGESETPKL
jgi:hypothetical protein